MTVADGNFHVTCVGCASNVDTQLYVARQEYAWLRPRVFKDWNPLDSLSQLVAFEGVSGNTCYFYHISHGINRFFLFSPVCQEHFAELFGQDAAAESRRSQERFRKGLLAGMSLVAGIVVGSFIVLKRLWGETHERCFYTFPTCLFHSPLMTHHRN